MSWPEYKSMALRGTSVMVVESLCCCYGKIIPRSPRSSSSCSLTEAEMLSEREMCVLVTEKSVLSVCRVCRSV